jgi:integrase
MGDTAVIAMPAARAWLMSSGTRWPGATPHGLRHGHQTWMDEAGIPDVLKSERIGHELSGMRGVYSHVSPAMRADLKAALQERWQAALRERAQISHSSSVRLLDALLAAYQSPKV